MRGEPRGNLFQSASGGSLVQRTFPGPGRDGGVSRVDKGSTGGQGGRSDREEELLGSEFEARI